MRRTTGWILCLALLTCGCKTTRISVGGDTVSARKPAPASNSGREMGIDTVMVSEPSVPESTTESLSQSETDAERGETPDTAIEKPGKDDIALASAIEDSAAVPPAPDPDTDPSDEQAMIVLDHVIDSIYTSFPLLRVALFERNVAQGEHLAAQGEFDTKIYGDSLNAPLGFYQNYRQNLGIAQPLYGGGSVFGGYKLGRGYYGTWDDGARTNDGGEFRAGLSVPLWQNREIDERRTQLWVTAVGQTIVEPQIKQQLLMFIRDGSVAYWDWVAAGMQYRIATQLLALADDRQRSVEAEVKAGKEPESDLADNGRLIVARRVKQLDAERKLHIAAAKLSLFFRGPAGEPLVPDDRLLPPDFPLPMPIDAGMIEQDISFAVMRRPEALELALQRQQLEIERSQAQNLLQPELDAQVFSAKDIGAWSSPKGDKTPYQMEAGVTFSTPIQFRKARGKLQALEGKLAQNSAKRQYVQDKIGVEVRSAIVAIDTAYRSIDQAREAVRLNRQMEVYEMIRFDQGASDLLRINLREQATFDSRVAEVEAVQRYFTAQADYRAAIAADVPDTVDVAP